MKYIPLPVRGQKKRTELAQWLKRDRRRNKFTVYQEWLKDRRRRAEINILERWWRTSPPL